MRSNSKWTCLDVGAKQKKILNCYLHGCTYQHSECISSQKDKWCWLKWSAKSFKLNIKTELWNGNDQKSQSNTFTETGVPSVVSTSEALFITPNLWWIWAGNLTVRECPAKALVMPWMINFPIISEREHRALRPTNNLFATYLPNPPMHISW